MLGQPDWFYAAWKAQQWGIFAVSVIYCGAWMRGVWVYWIAPRQSAGGMATLTLPPESKLK